MLADPSLIYIGNSVLTVFIILIIIIIDIPGSRFGYAFIMAVFTFPQITIPIEEGIAVVALKKTVTPVFISAERTVPFIVILTNFLAAIWTFRHCCHLLKIIT